ncbi:hypothetical protein ACJ72_07844 [Emergomyces africanus]|uniref:Uncharacterized protein n=1 Tax=Emergomyces africanus TaxID=1955775 RepID=A0A1B7NM43_9EURO|nr:hypothetical protein ACJ72_07844 [Emergomyces africanus]
MSNTPPSWSQKLREHYERVRSASGVHLPLISGLPRLTANLMHSQTADPMHNVIPTPDNMACGKTAFNPGAAAAFILGFAESNHLLRNHPQVDCPSLYLVQATQEVCLFKPTLLTHWNIAHDGVAKYDNLSKDLHYFNALMETSDLCFTTPAASSDTRISTSAINHRKILT